MTDSLREYEDWARACMHVRCGLCRENCPAYRQFEIDSYSPKGRITLLHHLLEGNLETSPEMSERIHSCTGCGLCDVACGYPQSEAIQSLKTEIFQSGHGPPQAYAKIIDNSHKAGNPYGESGLSAVEFLSTQPESQFSHSKRVYFIGCTELYRDRNQVENTLEILRRTDTSFGLLAENLCCGSPVYRVGDRNQAESFADAVYHKLASLGTSELIISCSGCFGMLSNVYEDLIDGDFSVKVTHITKILDDLVKKGKLNLGRTDQTVTYHDPCHLGRHSGIYDEPRDVIEAIPGTTLVEMEWNRKLSRCCGAGGGLKAGRGEDAVAIAAMRVRDAEETGAQILATSCPFCLRNLRDGAETIQSDIEVSSVVSLVLHSINTNDDQL